MDSHCIELHGLPRTEPSSTAKSRSRANTPTKSRPSATSNRHTTPGTPTSIRSRPPNRTTLPVAAGLTTPAAHTDRSLPSSNSIARVTGADGEPVSDDENSSDDDGEHTKPESPGETNDDDTDTDDEVPGFGAVTAVLALALAALVSSAAGLTGGPERARPPVTEKDRSPISETFTIRSRVLINDSRNRVGRSWVPIVCAECETTSRVPLDTVAEDAIERHKRTAPRRRRHRHGRPDIADQIADLVATDLGLLEDPGRLKTRPPRWTAGCTSGRPVGALIAADTSEADRAATNRRSSHRVWSRVRLRPVSPPVGHRVVSSPSVVGQRGAKQATAL